MKMCMQKKKGRVKGKDTGKAKLLTAKSKGNGESKRKRKDKGQVEGECEMNGDEERAEIVERVRYFKLNCCMNHNAALRV